jgi:hypothetical protein
MAMLLFEVDDTGTYRRGHRDSSLLADLGGSGELRTRGYADERALPDEFLYVAHHDHSCRVGHSDQLEVRP